MSPSADVTIDELPGERVRVRVGGRVFVLPAACPHRKGRLAHGYVNANRLKLTCPLHKSIYDLETGCQTSGPEAGSLTVRELAGGTETPATDGLEQPWLPASEGIVAWGADFHALMLGDKLRMTAFRTAIREVVRPGSVVLDLGTGTGILAQWALEAGAARVYGIDFNADVLRSAVDRIAGTGFAHRFHPVKGMSYDIQLPERADVVISETLGNLADNESCVPILADARRRFLSAGGTMIPSQVESYLVPVSAVRAHDAVSAGWVRGGEQPSDPFSTYYDAVIPWTGHLATPRLARRYEFTPAESDTYQVPMSFTIRHDGVFTGFKGYFTANLSPSVAVDISGDDLEHATASDSWKHAYLPVRDPITVQCGDRVALSFSRRPAPDGSFGQRYHWAGTVLRGDTVVGRFEHESGRPGS
jgi:type I protein arginine methyltransferase